MSTALHPIKVFRKCHVPPLRLEDLAVRLGMTKANLSRIENGKQPISEELLPKLVLETGIPAKVLRPDLAELFQEPSQ